MKRSISPRVFALLTGGPLLADMMAMMILLAINLTAVRQGIEPRYQGWLGGSFAVAYVISAHFAGRILHSRNAGMFVIGGNLVVMALGSVGVMTTSFPLLLVICPLIGLSLAAYFVSFQVKMGNIRAFPTIAWTVAFYNISWGVGYAIGTLATGMLRQFDKSWMMIALWTLAALHLFLCLLANVVRQHESEDYHPSQAFASTPLQRRMGWVGIGVISLLLSGTLNTLWPNLGKSRNLSDWQIGLGAFVFTVQIPLWSLLWPMLRKYMASPWLLLGGLAMAAIAFPLLPMTGSLAGAMVVLAVLGASVSALFFHGVYYSNADPDSPGKSVGTNESIIGLGNMLGPVGLGALAWTNAASALPYRVGGLAALAAGAIVLALWLTRQRPRTSLPS